MSLPAAHAFVSLLLDDEELRERLQEPDTDIVVLGSARGLCFSEEEFQQAIAELEGSSDDLAGMGELLRNIRGDRNARA